MPTSDVTVGFVRPCSMSTKCWGLSPASFRRFLLAELLFGAKLPDSFP